MSTIQFSTKNPDEALERLKHVFKNHPRLSEISKDTLPLFYDAIKSGYARVLDPHFHVPGVSVDSSCPDDVLKAFMKELSDFFGEDEIGGYESTER